MLSKKLQFMTISVIFTVLVGSAIILYGSIAFAQQSQNTTSSTSTNTTGAISNITSLLKPGSNAANTLLSAKMLQLEASNKPQDIATLAYIWGYPLVTVAGSYAYYTTKGVPNQGEGPVQSWSRAIRGDNRLPNL